MSTFIISIIQYLITAGLVIGMKHNQISAWMLLIAVFIMLILNTYKANIKNYYLNDLYIMDLIVSCIPIFFFPTLKARIILVLISCLVIGIKARPLENGDDYNNEASTSRILSYIIIMHGLLNIYYCFNPGEYSRFWNIVFVIALLLIGTVMNDDVEGVQRYDEEQKKFNEERRKEKAQYEESDFYQAMKIPYSSMINDSGIRAEYSTSTWLSDISYTYKALYSVSIPVNDELGSTELDTIVISPAGIYVLEIKNRTLRWLIDGTDKNAYCFDKYEKKQIVHNPVVQNENHIKALRNFIKKEGTVSVTKALDVLDNKICGYIVFGENTIGWEITNCYQGYCNYKSIGKMIQSENEKIWVPDEDEYIWAINEIYDFLKKYENNKELRSKHDTLLKIRDWKRDFKM